MEGVPGLESLLKLRIGDIIYLKLEDDGEGWLCAEGHLGENVFLSTNTEDFHYGLWEVHVQNQYSSYNEYEEALGTSYSRSLDTLDDADEEEDQVALYLQGSDSQASKTTLDDQTGKEMFKQLRRAALNEQKLNERAMSTKVGTPVTFGDVIQLRHIVSRKFLSISTTLLAKQERENMRVLNVRNGNPYSALAFASRTQTQYTARSQIPNNCEVYIRVHERPGEYLRGAKISLGKYAKEKSNREAYSRGEANCSLEKTQWSINIYQPFKDFSSKYICAGRLVCLSDSETHSHLTVRTAGQPKDKFRSSAASGAIDSITTPVTRMKSIIQTVNKDAQVILRPRVGENPVNDLWRLEKRTIVKGGSISLSKDFVVFVHLSTNLYLHCRSTDGSLNLVPDRNRATEFDLRSSSVQGVGGNLNRVEDSVEEGSQITMSTISEFGKKVGLGSTALYVSVNSKKLKSATEMIIQPDVSAAMSIIISNTTQTYLGSDIYFGIETCRCLENFRSIVFAIETGDAYDSPRMIAASQAFQNVLNCLKQVVSWLLLSEGGSKSNKMETDSSFGLAPDTKESLNLGKL